jgi:peptide/nickel transport system permease protein
MALKSSAKWLVKFIISLLGISIVSFTLTSIIPGDPVELMLSALGKTPSPTVIEKARNDLGLDKPIAIRYLLWLSRAVQGDFGVSYFSQKPVLMDLADKFPYTLKLAVLALICTIIISTIVGTLAALIKGGIFDGLVRTICFMGISLPGFLLGLLLLYLIGLKFKLLPVMSSSGSGKAIILPVVTLALSMSFQYIRQVRNLVLEELGKEYVLGARARGLSKFIIIFRHVIPNVFIPLVTLFGLSFGAMLGGSVLIEVIFVYPGIGNYAVQSISRRDYPVVQAYVLWLSVVYMLINLLVDLSYRYLDPRVREAEDN